MASRRRRDREIRRALARSAELAPPAGLDARVRARLAEAQSDPLRAALRASAALEPPAELDRALRARIGAWRPESLRRPRLAPLGAAAASLATLYAGLVTSLDGLGLGAHAGAALALSAYLALSAVAAAPLLLALRRRLASTPREAGP